MSQTLENESVKNARLSLKIAIECHKAAAAEIMNASQNLEAAQAFVGVIKRQLSDFADVDAKIAHERATAIKSALQAGKSPKMEISSALAEMNAKRLELENQLNAAQQATAAIAGELAQAQSKAGNLKNAINAAIAHLVELQLEERGARLCALQAEARQLYALIYSGSFLSFGKGPVPLSRETIGALHAPSLMDDHHAHLLVHGNQAGNMRIKWGEFVEALSSNPDSVFDQSFNS